MFDLIPYLQCFKKIFIGLFVPVNWWPWNCHKTSVESFFKYVNEPHLLYFDTNALEALVKPLGKRPSFVPNLYGTLLTQIIVSVWNLCMYFFCICISHLLLWCVNCTPYSYHPNLSFVHLAPMPIIPRDGWYSWDSKLVSFFKHTCSDFNPRRMLRHDELFFWIITLFNNWLLLSCQIISAYSKMRHFYIQVVLFINIDALLPSST